MILSIGDICLVLRSYAVGIVGNIGPTYQLFLQSELVVSSDVAASADIIMKVHPGGMPKTDDLPKVFESEQIWALYLHDEQYRLIYRSPLVDQLSWVVDANRRFTEVTFYGNANPDFGFPGPLELSIDRTIFMHFLAQREGAIIHSAGMMSEGNVYVFAGKSGAGKTTVSRLLTAREGMTMLSDDRMIVRKMAGEYRAYGTPWPGEARIAVNAGAPLAGIFFLTQDSRNQIRPLSVSDALTRLMPVISIPWYDRECVAAMLQFCDDLLAAVPVYELRFRRDPTVVDMIQEFMTA